MKRWYLSPWNCIAFLALGIDGKAALSRPITGLVIDEVLVLLLCLAIGVVIVQAPRLSLPLATLLSAIFPRLRARQRSRQLARDVLPPHEAKAALQGKSIDIASTLYIGVVYRVPTSDSYLMVKVLQDGYLVGKLCAAPEGDLPDLDVAIGRIFFLRSDEVAFLKNANFIPVSSTRLRYNDFQAFWRRQHHYISRSPAASREWFNALMRRNMQ